MPSSGPLQAYLAQQAMQQAMQQQQAVQQQQQQAMQQTPCLAQQQAMQQQQAVQQQQQAMQQTPCLAQQQAMQQTPCLAQQQAMQQQQAVQQQQQQAMQQTPCLAQQLAYQQQMPPMPSTAPSAADPPDPSGATPKHPAPKKFKARKGPAQTPAGTATHEIQRKAKAHVHDGAASRREDNRYTKAMEQLEEARERANALEREKVELVKKHTQKLQQVHEKYTKKIEACGLWAIKAFVKFCVWGWYGQVCKWLWFSGVGLWFFGQQW